MTRGQTRNPINDILKRATELAGVNGAPSRESGAGRGGALSNEDVTTTANEDGYTVYPAMTELDFTDNPNALTSI